MSAFYNECDPFAAQWLRNLIAAGHITPGIVDERPIQEIETWELIGFTQCHFFAGIGVWSLALRQVGWPDDRPIWTGSCPCQPFSNAGKRKGFGDERHLWPYWKNLVEQCRPPIVVGEQVASALDWLDLVSADLERAGYAFGAADLCAAGFDGAHIRQRNYFVALANAAQQQQHRSGGGGARRGFEYPDDGAVVRMADYVSGRQSGEGWPCSTQEGRTSELCRVEWLANNSSTRLEIGPLTDERRGTVRVEGEALAQSLLSDRLEHGPSDGRFERRSEPSGRSVASGRSNSGMDHSSSSRHVRAIQGAEGKTRLRLPSPGRKQGHAQRPNAPMLGRTPVDWLYCRDGKWRPVEPGTFPLADAAPTRVGRLRAYGNALDAETAAQFCQAVKEICDQIGI